MKLTFWGAAHEVTGSCHMITVAGKHILVDCGMEQGPDLYENQEIPVNASLIDYVFITHAHIDHSGLLPLLYSHGFRGQIFATKATTELCNIMLKDSAHIQEFEAEWKNRKARRAGLPEVQPLYDMNDAIGVLGHFVECDYNHQIEVCDGLKVRFVDAGHLLGSSSIEMWITEREETRKIVFSGDLGNGHRPLIKDPETIEDADYVLIESTYGTRNHSTPPDYAVLLAEAIRDTFNRGGNLVIPAFSVGRTQELLYFLRRIKTEELLPEFQGFQVVVDSPLAVEATNIFHKNVIECFNDSAKELVSQGINPIRFEGLKVSVTSEDSKAINFDEQSKVIISASGMCEAGRIRHHLKHNLWRPECTILFVGYQAAGTLGRVLIDGVKEVKLFGESVEVRADIRQLPGLSGHADKNGLIEWVNAFEKKPARVFIVHGEDSVCNLFSECLKIEHGHRSYAPYSGTRFDLITNTIEYEAAPVVVKKRVFIVSDVFQRLLAAGQRLISVIHKNEGGANKDLAKFADQINALCDKWER